MIRAALALLRGDRRAVLSRPGTRLAGARSTAHYANPDNGGYFLTADDAEGLVVRPAPPATTPRPIRTRIAAQNLIRLAAFAGDHAWREKADRLIEGVLSAAGENLFGHASLLNALDLRLRAAEIVVTGSGDRADALAAAALKLRLLDPHRAACAVRGCAAGRTSGRDKIGAAEVQRSCVWARAVRCPSRSRTMLRRPCGR